MSSSSGDVDKLKEALSLLPSVGSMDDVMSAFGLNTLPTAHRYGIFFGCVVFTLTVTAVMVLLVKGGSIQRITEQSRAGEATPVDAVKERSDRPLLLERLLIAREQMIEANYPEDGEDAEKASEEWTKLTEMLLNVAPDTEKLRGLQEVLECDDDGKGGKGNKNETESQKLIPDGYVKDYLDAYRKCQDEPGGARLPSLPEARYEAFARAYAGCGTHPSASYRTSYARMYEAVTCQSEALAERFEDFFEKRPWDLVGRSVRLEPLEVERHLDAIYTVTCGEANTKMNERAFDPQRVWGFLNYGPFKNASELRQSPVFQKRPGEAAFAILENLTDRVIGVVALGNDDPWNLNVQLEPPIVKPSTDGTVEQIEACFLLMDRLFALGYRRIELCVDKKDVSGKKLSGRLGFTFEATLPKHMIVKDSNRDSNVYGMLNSDWDKGARNVLYKKLHGTKAQTVDGASEAKVREKELQQKKLQEMKEAEGK